MMALSLGGNSLRRETKLYSKCWLQVAARESIGYLANAQLMPADPMGCVATLPPVLSCTPDAFLAQIDIKGERRGNRAPYGVLGRIEVTRAPLNHPSGETRGRVYRASYRAQAAMTAPGHELWS